MLVIVLILSAFTLAQVQESNCMICSIYTKILNTIQSMDTKLTYIDNKLCKNTTIHFPQNTITSNSSNDVPFSILNVPTGNGTNFSSAIVTDVFVVISPEEVTSSLTSVDNIHAYGSFKNIQSGDYCDVYINNNFCNKAINQNTQKGITGFDYYYTNLSSCKNVVLFNGLNNITIDCTQSYSSGAGASFNLNKIIYDATWNNC